MYSMCAFTCDPSFCVIWEMGCIFFTQQLNYLQKYFKKHDQYNQNNITLDVPLDDEKQLKSPPTLLGLIIPRLFWVKLLIRQYKF